MKLRGERERKIQRYLQQRKLWLVCLMVNSELNKV